MRQSIGADNRDQIIKDLESLALEKYVDEIVGAAVEGVGKCKTEKDIWSAVEVRLRLAYAKALPLTPHRSFLRSIGDSP